MGYEQLSLVRICDQAGHYRFPASHVKSFIRGDRNQEWAKEDLVPTQSINALTVLDRFSTLLKCGYVFKDFIAIHAMFVLDH